MPVLAQLQGVHITLNGNTELAVDCNCEWLFEDKEVKENSFTFEFPKCLGYMLNRLCYHH